MLHTNKQTDKQTDRRPRTSYSCRADQHRRRG